MRGFRTAHGRKDPHVDGALVFQTFILSGRFCSLRTIGLLSDGGSPLSIRPFSLLGGRGQGAERDN